MISDSKKTILLVEDMAIIAMAEANMLKKNGFDVIVAYNGKEAIKIASENSILDLILMDIDLGKGMDGTEAAQIILKNHEVPIVFLSNHTEKEVVEKTEKITSYGYVVKNSGETVLIASIKMAFKLFDAHRLRLESENKLLESDRKFHTLEKQIDDVIWTMDMNFRFTYISPSVEKLHGYTVDEMMKLNLQDYLTPDSTQKVINILGEQISEFITNKNEGTIITVNIDQIKKDGTIFPTEIRARFLLDNYKNPIGMIGVTRDITERQKSREALLESKKALDLALEGAQIGFWDSNYLTGKVYRSEIWASMLGYTLDEIENSPQFWSDLIHPDDLERVLAEVRKHEAGECEHFNIEHRIRTKSGDYKWILDWGKVFERSESGKPIRAMGVHIDIDNRIAVEQKLLETNKTLNLALEGAQIGLWDQNFKTGIVKRSAHWATMLGFDPDEIKNDLDFWKSNIHPDDIEITLNEAAKHEQGLTEFYKVQHRLKCKNGSYKWILNWGKISERDDKGNPVRGLGIHLDIDANLKIEEALRESEYNFRTLFEIMTTGVVYHESDGKIISANPAAQEILGLTLEQMQGKTSVNPLWKCIHEDGSDFPGEEHPVMIALKTGKVIEDTIMGVFHPKKNRYVWININAIPKFKSVSEKPFRVYVTFEDITQRKLAEENLKQSEENYRRFFKEDLSGVFLSTPEGGIKTCNQAYADMMEYKSIDELIRSNPVSHYQQSQQRIDFLNLLRKEKKLTNYEGELVTKKGKQIQTLENILGVFDDEDNLVEFWGYVNDITDRKKAEQILKNAAIEKEALHRELLHRVKNSFNLIKSLMYLEREKIDNKEANKILENLEMRIGTLSKMYSLLNLSGISQKIDLGEYLNQITISLAESYIEDAARIEIKSSFDDIETTPKTASSVGLIVNEILTNSLKYAFPDNKKGNIYVSLKKTNEDAVIEITDDGVGVANNFNINEAKGMGLQLINMLTQQLSGIVIVEANNGTRFKIVFPLEQ